MNPILLNLLACPSCQGDLKLEVLSGTPDNIIEGSLKCACSKVFKISDDVPFFSPIAQHEGIKNQQRTYSAWWDDYHDEPFTLESGHRGFFYDSLRIRADEMNGKIVLDGGCGSGRFSFVVSHYQPKLLVSFDISSGLLHTKKTISRHNPDANVVYVQGDITHPPFKRGVFDIVFSWGVIHHTPDTRATFSIISRLVKERGRLGIFVYEFHPLYRYKKQTLSLIAYLRSLFVIKPLRFLCSRLPAKIVHRIFIPVYYFEKLLNFGFVGCHGAPGDKWNKEHYFQVVIDRFKTRYASEHQLEEVIQWFQEEGYNQLCVGWKPRVSVSGTKEKFAGPLHIDMATCSASDPSIPQELSAHSLKVIG